MNIILTTILALFLNHAQTTTGYAVGDKVSDFTLKNTVSGKNVSLSEYNAQKGAIVVFTCIHCPCAQAYEQRIMDLDKKYASLGYPVIAINANDPKAEPSDSPENMAKRAKDKSYTFPYLFDDTQNVAKAFGAVRTPHVFILKKTSAGFVVSYIGAIDDNQYDANATTHKYVEEAVDALLAGKQPEITFTKAIGCTIKWKM